MNFEEAMKRWEEPVKKCTKKSSSKKTVDFSAEETGNSLERVLKKFEKTTTISELFVTETKPSMKIPKRFSKKQKNYFSNH